MRVWLVSNMYPAARSPYYGIFVKNIVDGLRGQGVTVDPSTVMPKRCTRPERLGAYLRFVLGQVRDGLCSGWDLAFIHFPKRSAFPSAFLAALRRKPFVFNFHGTDAECRTAGRVCLGAIARRAQMVVVPSGPFGGVVSRRFGIDVRRLHVSPSGGLGDAFFAHRRQTEVPIIGLVSRIVQDKGWETMIRALVRIRSRRWQAEIYGDGPDVARLVERLQTPQLADRVRYCGRVPHESLPDVYSRFSVFVFPSERGDRESLGLVGLEAMAAGVPVIGSDTGGIPSYLSHGTNGFLFNPGDDAELADRLTQVLSLSTDEQARMSERARSTAQRFARTTVASDLCREFESILAGRPQRP